MMVLLDALDIGGNLIAVHCTHTAADDLLQFIRAGGRVCVCPLTEANLGDGLPLREPVPDILERLCLGSDSNARISPIEELRWLEYGQRLRLERRGVLRKREGEVASVLLDAATCGGARALSLPAGRDRDRSLGRSGGDRPRAPLARGM